MYGQETCNYTIFNRPNGNVWDFVGPFTTSCEAQTRIVSKRSANRVMAAVRDAVSGPTQLFLLDDIIQILSFHLCYALVRVILTVPNDF